MEWDSSDVQAWAKRVAGAPKPLRATLKAYTGKDLVSFTVEVRLSDARVIAVFTKIWRNRRSSCCCRELAISLAAHHHSTGIV